MNLISWFNFYIIIMFLSLSTSNWLSMWTMLEISSWIMLILIISDEMNFSSMFKMYFMFSIISIMLLSMWMTNIVKQQWILLLFSLKMAIPPCHWWLSWIMKDMKWKMMWWFTTMHKFMPMMFSLLILNMNMLMLWCIMSSIFSAMSTWMSNSVFNIIFFSSCMHSNWMWISIYDMYNFMMYFIMYTTMMLFIFHIMEKWNFFQSNFTLSLSMLMIIGFPTSFLFFMKMNITNLFSSFNTMMMWMILLSNILMIYPYTRMIWISFNNNMKSKFINHNKNMIKPLYLVMLIFQFTIWPMMI
uniref:NADH dehydrogenase subunit 2 n=1 Tax=Aonchotheca putorii TaxID=1647945 RepID=UPI00237C441E|nr:NADH dehydrogenase subunit 2 [Aonchotheca putorii]WBV76978.1 NADH dehydrogenase subunit 2 [Aonchotheca putorii]